MMECDPEDQNEDLIDMENWLVLEEDDYGFQDNEDAKLDENQLATTEGDSLHYDHSNESNDQISLLSHAHEKVTERDNAQAVKEDETVKSGPSKNEIFPESNVRQIITEERGDVPESANACDKIYESKDTGSSKTDNSEDLLVEDELDFEGEFDPCPNMEYSNNSVSQEEVVSLCTDKIIEENDVNAAHNDKVRIIERQMATCDTAKDIQTKNEERGINSNKELECEGKRHMSCNDGMQLESVPSDVKNILHHTEQESKVQLKEKSCQESPSQSNSSSKIQDLKDLRSEKLESEGKLERYEIDVDIKPGNNCSPRVKPINTDEDHIQKETYADSNKSIVDESLKEARKSQDKSTFVDTACGKSTSTLQNMSSESKNIKEENGKSSHSFVENIAIQVSYIKYLCRYFSGLAQ